MLRQHFQARHAPDIITILKEGPVPLPQGPNCDLQSATALSPCHAQSKSCAIATAAKRQRLARDTAALAKQTIFTINGAPLEKVSTFKYLG